MERTVLPFLQTPLSLQIDVSINANGVEKALIVAHDHKRAIKLAQTAFQQFYCLDIEVIGRLI